MAPCWARAWTAGDLNCCSHSAEKGAGRGFIRNSPRRLATLATLLLGFAAGPAWAGIARVQSASASGLGSILPAWAAPTAPGNLLVASVSCLGGTGTTITAPAGWTVVTRVDNGTTIAAAVYVVTNAASQSGTSNWTCSGLSDGTLSLAEYSGAVTASVADVTATATGTGTAAQTGTVVPNQPGELAIAVFASNSSSTASGYSGALVLVNQPTDSAGPITAATAQAVLTTAGPLAAGATLSGSATWVAVLATFKAAQPGTHYWTGSAAGYFDDDTRWSSTSGGLNDTSAPNGTGQSAVFDGNGNGDCVFKGDPNLSGIQMSNAPGSGYGGALRTQPASTGALSGPGLSGDWYAGVNFDVFMTTVLDATVNYTDLTAVGMARTGTSTLYSARYTGQVKASFGETYTFYTQSDDGVRLYVNGQLLVDNWTLHSSTENSGTITLAANSWYDVRLEYFQQNGNSVLQLKYSSASEAKKIIPSTNLRSLGGTYYQGLSSDWYSGIAFDTYKANARDTTVDFADTTGVGAVRTGSATSYSGRWTGQVLATYGETYTFYTQSDDGVRLYVNGSLLIDHWNDHTTTEDSSTIVLAAGQWYDLKLEYYNDVGAGAMQLKFQSASEGKKIVPATSLRTSAPAYLSGLSGDWYAGINYDTYLATFTDSTINYSDLTATATARINRSEYYSVRWSGQLLATTSETYTLYTQSAHGVRLYVNNALVVNDWTNHNSVEDSGSVSLTAGTWYDIKLEYYQFSGASVIQLSFQSPTITKQIVPAANLRRGPPQATTLTLGPAGLDQRAGTVVAGSRNISLGGNLALSGGSFQSTSGLLNVGGTFNKTGGSFGSDIGRLMATSTSNQVFGSAGATFRDLYFNDGLVGYWKLDETSGTTSSDSSGYGASGQIASFPPFTTTGLAPLAFTDAAALTFAGSGQGVTVAHNARMSFTAAQSYTLSAWVSANNLSSASVQAVVVKARNTTAYYGIYVSASPPHWLAGASGANVTGSVVTAGWHHVAIVQDGAGNRRDLYVDGVSVGNGVAANGSGIGDLWIGRSSAVETFAGTADDVRIYNRALAASEIATLSHGNQPSTGIATETIVGGPVVSGTLGLMSGTIAGSSAITVGGSWLNSGAAYLGTGAVTFNATTAGSSILSGGQPFSALTINGIGGGWTLADRLWASGAAVTLTAGTLNGGAWSSRMGTFISAGTFTPGTGTVILDGRFGQTLSIPSFNGLRLEATTETGLVGYWKLDAGTGPRLADYSGSGNTGALSTSAQWTTAVPALAFDNPAALSLNGASAYGSMGATSLPANNAVQSLTAWAKFGSSTASQSIVALTRTASSSGNQLGLGGGNVRAFQYGGTDMVTKTAPTDGLWHHLAYTYDGTTERLYIDGGTPATATGIAHQTATPDASWIGTSNGGADFFNGQVDDVRVYNVALSAAQVAALAAGRYAGTGGLPTVTLGATLAASGPLAIDNDNLTTGTRTLTASLATSAATLNNGTYLVGSAAQTFGGGLAVRQQGTVTMASSGGSLSIGATKTLTIDGTLNASTAGAVIQSSGGTGTSYAFTVGSTASATPILNISGLTVQNTDTNGMWIGATTAAQPVFTRFDNVAFSKGTGTQLLQINAAALYLSSSGCTFDPGVAATTTYSVTLAGNGTGDGETRAIFGGATCASSATSCQATKHDDDSGNDGLGDTPASNGAVVQFVRAAADDTAGTVVGFPTAAFDWNTFTYYSTYAAFHNASSGTSDAIYVRDESGNPLYAWTVPTAGETITGTPQWNSVTVGPTTTHYLYVATSAGHVYRLIDTATGTTSGTLSPDVSGAWATNPYSCSCTIVTPLNLDATNLYWGGTPNAGGQGLWTLGQAAESVPTGAPFTVTPTITSTSPARWTSGATSYLFLGLTGHILKINVSNQTLGADNSSPASASVWGRISVGTRGGATHVFAGDDAGTMWAIDAATFSGTNKLWSYSTANAIKGSSYYDQATDTLQYGTQGGTIIVLTGAGAVFNTGYPYTPAGGAGDAIQTAPLFTNGVLVVGSTGGKLSFIDRTDGAATPMPALIRQYNFGPTESVSGVAYDPNVGRFMVTTSSAANKDGRLYYFDSVTDPTPGAS
jgi:Concanavalin A-like lectin/glucanases superfamily/PA14 domain